MGEDDTFHLIGGQPDTDGGAGGAVNLLELNDRKRALCIEHPPELFECSFVVPGLDKIMEDRGHQADVNLMIGYRKCFPNIRNAGLQVFDTLGRGFFPQGTNPLLPQVNGVYQPFISHDL